MTKNDFLHFVQKLFSVICLFTIFSTSKVDVNLSQNPGTLLLSVIKHSNFWYQIKWIMSLLLHVEFRSGRNFEDWKVRIEAGNIVTTVGHLKIEINFKFVFKSDAVTFTFSQFLLLIWLRNTYECCVKWYDELF